ncbi:MAG: orotate phosphoribosyltransferase [Candidatus Kaiserbacteria bacterium]|nr:orotate phosphoribosyltransferase [Candidatus Kaiserbacteria bacterium]
MAFGALRFGEFKTKAGRLSPYFFNAGLFSDGASLGKLASFYADRLAPELGQGSLVCDVLFGPAYKGIPLVSTTAVMLAMHYGRNIPYAYNRKEAKDHGEGGTTVGAHIRGKVLIIDDVISAGTSVRESIDIIRGAGAEPAGVLIALDRQERGQGELSAVQEVNEIYGIPVFSIASLEDIIAYLQDMVLSPLSPDILHEAKENLNAVLAYKAQYGVAP